MLSSINSSSDNNLLDSAPLSGKNKESLEFLNNYINDNKNETNLEMMLWSSATYVLHIHNIADFLLRNFNSIPSLELIKQKNTGMTEAENEVLDTILKETQKKINTLKNIRDTSLSTVPSASHDQKTRSSGFSFFSIFHCFKSRPESDTPASSSHLKFD